MRNRKATKTIKKAPRNWGATKLKKMKFKKLVRHRKKY